MSALRSELSSRAMMVDDPMLPFVNIAGATLNCCHMLQAEKTAHSMQLTLCLLEVLKMSDNNILTSVTMSLMVMDELTHP